MFEKYDAYKDSGVEWLGEIPNHWSIIKLKRVVKEHSGNGFPIELQGSEDGSIPFLKVSDISGEFKSIIKSSNYVTDKIRRRNKWNLVPKNSIVTGKIGEALRKNHRKILLEDSIIDNNCIGIEAVKINYNFSYYLHKVIDFEWFVNPGTVPSISVSKYKSFKVCLPSENEQEIIVNFLDQKTSQIDQAIAIKEQQIVLLNERKKIVIQKAVTQGLDPNVPMKDSDVEWIGQIPEHWDIQRLGTMLEPVSKKGNSDKALLSITRGKGVILRNIEDDSENHNFIPDDLSNYKLIEKGQFGMNKMKAWQGSYGVSPFTGIVSPAYYVFRFIKPIYPEFFHWAIRSKLYVSFFGSASDGVRIGQWDLSKDRMKKIPFVYPALDEQKKIVEHLKVQMDLIAKGIQLYTAQIEKLKEYKTTLINDAVTGKIKVA